MRNIEIMASVSALVFIFFACGAGDEIVEEMDKDLARVTYTSGEVLRTNEAGTSNVSPGDVLRTADLVITGGGATAEFYVEGQGIIRIGENAELLIESLVDSETGLDMKRGSAGFFLQRAERQGEFTVSTPTTVAAVRGTSFLIDIESEDSSRVALFDGSIELRNSAGDSMVLDRQGEITVGRERSQFGESAVRPLSEDSLEQLRDMAVFQDSQIREYNSLVEQLHSLEAFTEAGVGEGTVSERMERLGGDSSRPQEYVEGARSAEESVIERDTEGDPIRVPAERDFQ